MKILHVIAGIDRRGGGPATALIGLTKALTAQGVDVTVAATWRKGDDLSAAEELRGHGINVELIGPCRGPTAWHPHIRPVLKTLIAKTDVVHIHALWEEIQHQSARIAYRTGVPYVIRPCGMLDPWSLAQSRLKKKLYMAWRLRRNLNRATAVHFTSETERDLTTSLGLRAASIVEANGLDLTEFENAPPPGTFRSSYPQIGDRRIVLFLSRLHPKKGLDLLIPAFARAAKSDEVLVIAGPGSSSYVEKIKEMVNGAKLNSRIILTGMLHGQDRVAALVDADLFVLPSYQENFGIAVIESLASGTPVLISDQVNIHGDIAAAGVGGVVPTDVDALTKYLERWLSDDDLRHQAAAKARSFVKERYDWNSIAHAWINQYTRLAKTSS